MQAAVRKSGVQLARKTGTRKIEIICIALGEVAGYHGVNALRDRSFELFVHRPDVRKIKSAEGAGIFEALARKPRTVMPGSRGRIAEIVAIDDTILVFIVRKGLIAGYSADTRAARYDTAAVTICGGADLFSAFIAHNTACILAAGNIPGIAAVYKHAVIALDNPARIHGAGNIARIHAGGHRAIRLIISDYTDGGDGAAYVCFAETVFDKSAVYTGNGAGAPAAVDAAFDTEISHGAVIISEQSLGLPVAGAYIKPGYPMTSAVEIALEGFVRQIRDRCPGCVASAEIDIGDKLYMLAAVFIYCRCLRYHGKRQALRSSK